MTLDKFFEAVLHSNDESKLNEAHPWGKEYELHNDIVESINKLYEFLNDDDKKVIVILSDAICNSDVPIDIIRGVARNLITAK